MGAGEPGGDQRPTTADVLVHDYCSTGRTSSSDAVDGKFLQLLIDGWTYLVFSPTSVHRYHNQMLAQFLKDRGVAHHWVSREQLEYDTTKLEVIGGGRFQVNHREEILDLWDDSHAFGRFDEQGLAESIARADHPWHAYRVRIS
ncbi:MAG: hypothetical protein QNJ87_10820 [Gammaproteobacteria bacterium]|nr:hypothetical protein [Gammaproteobacteria bacterium]MDJ0872245.1 hypothetical protein [Gammaproteobacteria bacterium]